ncbi:uncharacterized protein F5147DRAFT_809701 [Suillus discolor]|uniref:Uncharacterized protein n=1 Tax=Suillus discolor TaxID=1912936 RepID=A0A9P7EQ24_9AGAM|nr:uncharacterized protein F5147DRAFT_809701 [Suillus discolor]KAG2081112.1 hypothetical protein F5147DRAFT_809701 [Suillus discolor]
MPPVGPLIVVMVSTFGIYLIASLLYWDPWHIFSSFFQYLCLAPSFTNNPALIDMPRERTLAQHSAALLQLSADIGPPVEKEDGMTEEEIEAVDDYKKALSHQIELTENLKKQITWTPLSFVSASTDVGRQVITDAPWYSTQLASEFPLDLSISPLPNGPPPTSKKVALPSTPKSCTILASDGNEWTEWTVSQQVNSSPAQREANLQHIKKNRHRVEESATGDWSVKQPDDSLPIKTIKTEEVVVEESHNQEQTSSLLEEGTSARSTTTSIISESVVSRSSSDHADLKSLPTIRSSPITTLVHISIEKTILFTNVHNPYLSSISTLIPAPATVT